MSWSYKPSYLLPFNDPSPHEQSHFEHFKWANVVGCIIVVGASFTVFFGHFMMQRNIANGESGDVAAYRPFLPCLICLVCADVTAFLSFLISFCYPVCKDISLKGFSKQFQEKHTSLVGTTVFATVGVSGALIVCASLPFLTWYQEGEGNMALRYITTQAEWPKGLATSTGRGYMAPTAILHFFGLGACCVAVSYQMARHYSDHRQDLSSYMLILLSASCIGAEVYCIDTIYLVSHAGLDSAVYGGAIHDIQYGPTFWILIGALIVEGSAFFLSVYTAYVQQQNAGGGTVQQWDEGGAGQDYNEK